MTTDDGVPESLLQQATHGYRSTLLSQAVRVLCKAVSVVVLARLVAPAEHGLFAMAASVFYVLVLFRDLGLGAAAVQARELSEEQRSTLWQAHVLLGLALAAVALALAPVVAVFYHETRVASLLAFMSASLLLIGLNAWPRVLLARDLRFAELNRLETFGAVVGTVAMLIAGACGAGAYAFAVFLLVSEGATLVGAWRACRWRPRVAVRWQSIRGLWRTGADLTGYNVLLCVLQQLDTLLMGRWFGAAALGFYSRPGQLLALPMQHLGGPITQVLLATLSRLAPGSPEFARYVRDTANLIAHLTLPLAVVCATLPDEIVQLLLGPAWRAAAPLLRWLSLNAATSYLAATVYGVCVAAAHTRRLAVMSSISLVATLLGLWLGRTYGPEGLAAGAALANLALLGPRLWWTTRGTPVRPRDFAAALAGPFAVAACLAAGSLAGRVLVRELEWGARLGAGFAGGIVAAAALTIFWPELRGELRRIWQHRPSAPAFDPAAPVKK